MTSEEIERPNWTVVYNIVSPENDKWVGMGWEFFDDQAQAKMCYERQIQCGNCPAMRPYHPNDIDKIGAAHRNALAASQHRQAEQAAKCPDCGGDGYYKGPRLGDEPCPGCSGTGKVQGKAEQAASQQTHQMFAPEGCLTWKVAGVSPPAVAMQCNCCGQQFAVTKEDYEAGKYDQRFVLQENRGQADQQPDEATMRKALADVDVGRWKTPQQIVNELKAEQAAAGFEAWYSTVEGRRWEESDKPLRDDHRETWQAATQAAEAREAARAAEFRRRLLERIAVACEAQIGNAVDYEMVGLDSARKLFNEIFAAERPGE